MDADKKVSGPVEVLAEMQADIDALEQRVLAGEFTLSRGYDKVNRLRSIHAAVAELFEAANCFTCAIAEDSSYRDDLLSAIRELERASFVEQLNRVRSALTNVGGAK